MQEDLITGTRFFGASVMVILAFVVAFMSRGKSFSHAYDSARWLLVMGTMVLGIHNLTQFVGHFREESVGTAWVVNLLFFCVTCPSYNLAEMHLLRSGRRTGQMAWLAVGCIVLIFVLCGAGHAAGVLVNDSFPLLSVCTVVAGLITVMLLVQDFFICRDFASERGDLPEQERAERRQALAYTSRSMKFLMASALLTPWSGMFPSLAFHSVFGLVMFVAMVWHLANFCLYGRSLALAPQFPLQQEAVAEKPVHGQAVPSAEPQCVSAAEGTEADAAMGRIEACVERWIGEKHYVDPDLKIETALRQMNLSLAKLNFYLDNVAQAKGYRQWISSLRIEHAKRMMKENPNYTLDAIAAMSGFANRRSLSNVFKAQVGVSPSQWMEQEKGKTR